MSRIYFLICLFLLILASAASADTIYLKNGNQLEVEGAHIEGDKVVFTVFNGRMEIDLSAVEKIEKSTGPAAADAGLRNAVRGKPFRTATSSSGNNTNGEGGQTDSSDDEQAEELVQHFLQQKRELDNNLKVMENQIQTLRSNIYAKSAIFSDTSQDRQLLTKAEAEKRAIEERLQNLSMEARRAGLNPGQVRRIEAAQADVSMVTSQQQLQVINDNTQDTRDADVRMTEDKDDSDKRSSGLVLGEEPDEDEKKQDQRKQQ